MAIFHRGGIWYIDYYAGGMRHKEAVGPKKKDAEAAIGGIKKDIREGRWFPRKVRAVPFEVLVDEYERMEKSKKGYKDSKEGHLSMIREYFKGRLLSDLTTLDVERFKNDRKETPTRSNRPRCGSTVNREMATLKTMLNKGIRWEMIEKNPAARIKMFPEPPGRNNFLTVEEARRLIDACLPHLRPVVMVALETGMRQGEILGLKWADIRSGMIYLTGDRTKNGKPREIPMSKRLSEELTRLRNRRKTQDVSVASDLVFQPPRERKLRKKGKDGARGKLYVVTGPMTDINDSWKAATKKAGIAPGFHFHDLRHTTASWLKMAGVDDYTVMEIMGHSDFAMMKRYAHLSPEHKRKAIEKLSAYQAERSGPETVPNAG